MKSEDNEADIFMKNTTNVIFHNHQNKLVWDKINVDNEMKPELTQSENQQEGCSKPKSDKDRQTDCQTEI